jgi:hypothetical protein
MKRIALLVSLSFVAACASHAAAPRDSAQARSLRTPRVLLATAFEAPPAPAVGTLEIPNAHGEPQTVGLESIEVRAHTEGDFVDAEVDHVFQSEVEARTEGTFRFPLPDGAILLGMSMEIDGTMMSGEIVEREKARKVFEQIEDQMRDPALLEWDQGTIFQLRVFPLDPGEHKRIVLHYAAPLHGAGFVVPVQPAPGQVIGRAKVTLDGKTLLDERNLAARRDVSAPTARLPRVVEQTREGAHESNRFLAVHAAPDWSKVAPPPAAGPQNVLVVVDTSRSMLEERKLALGAVRKIVEALGPSDRFQLAASDIDTRSLGALTDASRVEEAIASLAAIEPDGATDVGAMLRTAKKLAVDGHITSVVYVGDGSATWGVTKADDLARVAHTDLGLPFHVMLLGDRADADTMQAIAAATGGMEGHPRTEAEADALARRIASAPERKHLTHARIAATSGDVYPAREQTLYEGDELVGVVKAPEGVELALVADGVNARIEDRPVAAKLVAERWAKARITALESMPGDHKDEIVKLSLDNGVLSKHTSLLVLESDEAYERFQIARRSAKHDGAPTVTGTNLESASSRVASLDPDHLQPGDPEVRIQAPASARKVTVVLPFGETKEATYDSEVQAWTVRFLVDRNTPDGTYEVLVTIVQEDGTIEQQSLHYVVDTQHPDVEVTMRPALHRPGTWEIRATQVISEREIAAAVPASQRTGTLEEQRTELASQLRDARRVDVRLPDGSVMALVPIALGEFRGYWTPSSPLAGPVTLHVVAFDRARNQSERDVRVR